jgi:hypothetical protein
VDGLKKDVNDVANVVGGLIVCMSGVGDHLASLEDRIAGLEINLKAVLDCKLVLSIFPIHSDTHNVFFISIKEQPLDVAICLYVQYFSL